MATMKSRSCLRPANSRRLFVYLSLGTWFFILIVYWFLLNRPQIFGFPYSGVLATVVVNVSEFVSRSAPLPMVPLTDLEPQVLLASAYLDPRFPNTIRVHAVGRVGLTQALYCRLAHANGSVYVTAALRPVTPAIPAQYVTYDGFYIDCPMPPEWKKKPKFISISLLKPTGPSSAFLRVQVVPSRVPTAPSLAACVCPLHFGEIANRRHLVAWIEMNRLLGVERFVFYNYSAPASLHSLFYHYNKVGLVDLLQWNLSAVPTALVGSWPPYKDKLHYYGQFVAFNECLYRLLHRFRYVMFSDLDELLVPTVPLQSLPTLLSQIDNGNTASFSFRLAYLRDDFPKEANVSDVIFLERGRREIRINAASVGPKSIVRPHHIMRMGIHDVVEFARNAGSTRVRVMTPEEGLLFHYKSPPRYLRQDNDRGVADRRVLRYREQLLKSIQRSMEAIERLDRANTKSKKRESD